MSQLSSLVDIQPAERRSLVTELLQDCNALRVMILRLENQILKNEAMIETLLSMRQSVSNEPVSKPQALTVVETVEDEDMTVPDMLRIALTFPPGANATFTNSSMIQRCLSLYPKADAQKVRAGIYPAMAALRRHGKVKMNDDGSMSLVRDSI